MKAHLLIALCSTSLGISACGGAAAETPRAADTDRVNVTELGTMTVAASRLEIADLGRLTVTARRGAHVHVADLGGMTVTAARLDAVTVATRDELQPFDLGPG